MRELKFIFPRLVVLCLAVLISSCSVNSVERKVNIDGYENLDIKGFAGASVDLIFSNRSCHKITLKDVNVQLNNKDKKVAVLSLKDEIVIPRRSDSIVIPTLWRLKDVDAMSALALSGSLLSGNVDQNIKIDISADIKAGPIKRQVERKGLSLKSVMKAIKE